MSLRWTHSQTYRLTGKQTGVSRQTDPRRSQQINNPAWHLLAHKKNVYCLSSALCANAQAVTFIKQYRQTSKQRSKQEEQQACCHCYLNAIIRFCMLGEEPALTLTPANLPCKTCSMCSGHVRANLRPHKQIFCCCFKVLSSAVDAQQRIIRSHTGKEVYSKQPGMRTLQPPPHIAGSIICCQFT